MGEDLVLHVIASTADRPVGTVALVHAVAPARGVAL